MATGSACLIEKIALDISSEAIQRRMGDIGPLDCNILISEAQVGYGRRDLVFRSRSEDDIAIGRTSRGGYPASRCWEEPRGISWNARATATGSGI